MKNFHPLISHLGLLLKKEKQKSVFVLLLSLMFSIYSLGQKVDFSQAANHKLSSPDIGRVNWINGDLNSQNSSYAEGMSVPQRIILSELTGTTHTLVFKFKVSETPGYGYDFITSWDQAIADAGGKLNGMDLFDAATNGVDRFADIDPNTSVTESQYQILLEGVATNIDLPAYVDAANASLASTLNDRVDAYKTAHGGQQPYLVIHSKNTILTSSLTFNGFAGEGGGGKLAVMTLTWETDLASDLASIEFAGHLAVQDPPNSGNGAASMHGSSYHIKLGSLDDENFTSGRDNQIRVVQPSIDCVPPNVDDQELHACDDGTGQASFTLDLTLQGNPTIEWFSDIDLTQSISSPYTSSGGTVYAKVTDNTGCYAVAEITLVVDPLPTVTADNKQVCFGDNCVTLTGSPTAPPGTATWSGTGVSDDQFCAKGLAADDYTVTYTYTSTDGCSNTATATVTVSELPTASISGGEFCKTGTTQLTITGTTGGTFTAAPPGLSISSTGLIDLAASTVGTYTVTYTFSDGTCGNTATSSVTVNALPTVYTLSSTPFCSGTSTGSITLSNSQTGVSYELFKVGTPDVSISSKNGTTGSSLTWTGLAGGTYYVVATNTTTNCTSTTAQITLTGSACATSYTQGFYGNSTANNKTCAGTNLTTLLNGLLSTQLQVGGATKGVIVPTAGTIGSFKVGGTGQTVNKESVSWLITIMPAGSTAAGLLGGNNTILTQFFNNYTTTGYLTKQTKISNVLLGQTIALSLNIRLSNGPGGVSLDVPNAIMTAVPANTNVYINTTQFKQLTGSCTTALGNCTNSYPLNKNVLKALSTKTIQGLLDLANEALNLGSGTGYTKNGSTFTWADLNLTIDAINRAFDRGALFNAFASVALSPCTNTLITSRSGNVTEQGVNSDVSVSTYPNPFKSTVNFQVVSPVSGDTKLEIFNVSGQKLKTIAWGYLQAGQNRSFSVDLPAATTSSLLVYKLIVGNKEMRGKLIQLK